MADRGWTKYHESEEIANQFLEVKLDVTVRTFGGCEHWQAMIATCPQPSCIRGCPLGRGHSRRTAVDDLVKQVKHESLINIKPIIETDTIIKRELLKELPNCEAFYRETWASGKVNEPVLLSWFFDGSPKGPEMEKTAELAQ